MTQMYSKYVFAQDVFDLYKLEISNSQPWHTHTHSHTKHDVKKVSSCIENMAFVPKYAHDNFCIVHKWFFLLVFLLSLVRFKQLQCRKVFDNNPIECVVHCKRSEPILFIMIIYIYFTCICSQCTIADISTKTSLHHIVWKFKMSGMPSGAMWNHCF